MFHDKRLAGFMFLTTCAVAGLNSHHLRASHVDTDRISGPHTAIIFARSEVSLWLFWLVGPSRFRAVLKRLNRYTLNLKWWPLSPSSNGHITLNAVREHIVFKLNM